jgi:uncharacterized protein involved in exopolysaccharide biosynthesis
MSAETATAYRDPDEGRDLPEMIAQVWARRWWVLASVVLFSVVFAAAAFIFTPKYRAAVVLMAANTGRNMSGNSLNAALDQIGGLASLANIGGSSDSETQKALAVLRSRQFTEGFIRDNKLTSELLFRDWDAIAGKWKAGGDAENSTAKAYRYFNKKIRTVIQDKKTGLVTLQIDWKDRIKAADWANELVTRLNAEMRSRAADEADASLGFLQKELVSTADIGTRAAIGRLIEEQVKRRMLANVTVEYAFQVVDRAMPPDGDDPIPPSRTAIIVAGPVTGFVAGIIAVLVFSGRRPRTAQNSGTDGISNARG